MWVKVVTLNLKNLLNVQICVIEIVNTLKENVVVYSSLILEM